MVYLNENEFIKSLQKYKHYTNEEVSDLDSIYASFYNLSLSLNGLSSLFDLNESFRSKSSSVVKLHAGSYQYLNNVLISYRDAQTEANVIMDNINTNGVSR